MMSDTIDKTLFVLHELVTTCKDGEEGYRLAADKERTHEISALLMQYSNQRTHMSLELREKIAQMGKTQHDGSSAAAALFRGWINIRAALSGGESEVVLEDCERGEDAAVRSYEEALKSDFLPPDIRTLVGKQYRDILEARNKIRALKEQKKSQTPMDFIPETGVHPQDEKREG